MRLWAVWGCDQIYGGLHGMESTAVIEGTEDDACEYAETLSREVIESYDSIQEYLEAQVREECEFNDVDYDEDGDDVYFIRNEIYDEDMEYGYIELDVNKLPTLDIEELDKMYYNYRDEFTDKYGIKRLD